MANYPHSPLHQPAEYRSAFVADDPYEALADIRVQDSPQWPPPAPTLGADAGDTVLVLAHEPRRAFSPPSHLPEDDSSDRGDLGEADLGVLLRPLPTTTRTLCPTVVADAVGFPDQGDGVEGDVLHSASTRVTADNPDYDLDILFNDRDDSNNDNFSSIEGNLMHSNDHNCHINDVDFVALIPVGSGQTHPEAAPRYPAFPALWCDYTANLICGQRHVQGCSLVVNDTVGYAVFQDLLRFVPDAAFKLMQVFASCAVAYRMNGPSKSDFSDVPQLAHVGGLLIPIDIQRFPEFRNVLEHSVKAVFEDIHFSTGTDLEAACVTASNRPRGLGNFESACKNRPDTYESKNSTSSAAVKCFRKLFPVLIQPYYNHAMDQLLRVIESKASFLVDPSAWARLRSYYGNIASRGGASYLFAMREAEAQSAAAEIRRSRRDLKSCHRSATATNIVAKKFYDSVNQEINLIIEYKTAALQGKPISPPPTYFPEVSSSNMERAAPAV